MRHHKIYIALAFFAGLGVAKAYQPTHDHKFTKDQCFVIKSTKGVGRILEVGEFSYHTIWSGQGAVLHSGLWAIEFMDKDAAVVHSDCTGFFK